MNADRGPAVRLRVRGSFQNCDRRAGDGGFGAGKHQRGRLLRQRDAGSKDAPGLGNTNGKNCRERQKYGRKRSSGWKPPRRKSLSFGKKGLQPESLSKEPFWKTDTKKRRTGWEGSPGLGVPGYANRPEKSCCCRTKEDQTVCVWEKSGLKRILDSQA